MYFKAEANREIIILLKLLKFIICIHGVDNNSNNLLFTEVYVCDTKKSREPTE